MHYGDAISMGFFATKPEAFVRRASCKRCSTLRSIGRLTLRQELMDHAVEIDEHSRRNPHI